MEGNKKTISVGLGLLEATGLGIIENGRTRKRGLTGYMSKKRNGD